MQQQERAGLLQLGVSLGVWGGDDIVVDSDIITTELYTTMNLKTIVIYFVAVAVDHFTGAHDYQIVVLP